MPPTLAAQSVAGPTAIANADVLAVLARLESRLAEVLELLLDQKTVKDWYTTAEVGEILGKSDYTIREWCRLGRVAAQKRACGRGTASEWIISHAELVRLRNEGLRPTAVRSNA
jgi:Helix-turn-helix domain